MMFYYRIIPFLLSMLFLLNITTVNLYSNGNDERNKSGKTVDSLKKKKKSRYTLSVGIGYQDEFILDDFFQHFSGGFIWTAGVEGRIGEKGDWAFELLFSKWYGKTRKWKNGRPVNIIETGNNYSIVFKYYFLNISNDFRTAVHLGFAPVPLFTWDGGLDGEYKIYRESLFIGFSARILFLLLSGENSKDSYFPSFITINLRYRI